MAFVNTEQHTPFNVDPSLYQPIKVLGQGSYGTVFLARDMINNRDVAVKKISQVFKNLIDAKRTLREIRILRALQHDNIIATLDIVPPPSWDDFNDLYVVIELMQTDVHQVIYSRQALSNDHCKYFMYQLLRGIKYIHGAHILHRDLKPSNLLLNEDCDLKICDFGLARVADPSQVHNDFLTEYVATRWYRAPEIMLSWSNYTKPVDLWSAGCIFAELLGGQVLFPGQDFVHQISLITDVIGTPSEEDIESISTEKARRYMRSLPFKPKVPFSTMFPTADAEAVDLLDGLLTFDPRKRLTVEQALASPYLATYHDPTDEPVPLQPVNFDFENVPLSKDALKEMIFEEIAYFHPDIRSGGGGGGGGNGGGGGGGDSIFGPGGVFGGDGGMFGGNEGGVFGMGGDGGDEGVFGGGGDFGGGNYGGFTPDASAAMEM